MATTYKADNYADPLPSFPGVGIPIIREFKFTVAVALVIDDIIKLGRLRGLDGEIVLDAYYIDTADLDTAGPAIKLDLGDNEDDDRYVAASTKGQAAAIITPEVDGVKGIIPKKIAVNTDLALHVDTAPTTGATAVVIIGWYQFHYTGIPTTLS